MHLWLYVVRWNQIDFLMVALSLLALMLNTSGISVVRLVRIFRVRNANAHKRCALHWLRCHGWVICARSAAWQAKNGLEVLILLYEQIVRIFGKFPGLRRIILSLTACTTPMIGAFSILVIFQCLCTYFFNLLLHWAMQDAIQVVVQFEAFPYIQEKGL